MSLHDSVRLHVLLALWIRMTGVNRGKFKQKCCRYIFESHTKWMKQVEYYSYSRRHRFDSQKIPVDFSRGEWGRLSRVLFLAHIPLFPNICQNIYIPIERYSKKLQFYYGWFTVCTFEVTFLTEINTFQMSCSLTLNAGNRTDNMPVDWNPAFMLCGKSDKSKMAATRPRMYWPSTCP